MITVGIIQIIFGTFKLAKLMNLVSRPTVLGFLNGLAVIILLSQLHAFREVLLFTLPSPFLIALYFVHGLLDLGSSYR
jgi:SulP family sulfate permease